MGIMHKLLKRRDFESQGFIMDLTKSKDNSVMSANQSHETDVHEDDLVPKLATEDNQFTAEHIVQLCKFLAEKSKRNKIISKRLNPNNQSPNKMKSRAPYQRESNMNQESAEAVNYMECSRLHDSGIDSLQTSTVTSHILADKYKINSNSGEELNQKHFAMSKKNCCAQDKRDILLKIRHQIFERKRQRQMSVGQQIEVWRPW